MEGEWLSVEALILGLMVCTCNADVSVYHKFSNCSHIQSIFVVHVILKLTSCNICGLSPTLSVVV